MVPQYTLCSIDMGWRATSPHFSLLSGAQLTLVNISLVGGSGAVQDGFDYPDGATTGGALFIDTTSAATLQGCRLAFNSASLGGAVHNFGALTAMDTVWESNTATQDGGAIFVAAGATTALTRCTLRNNVAVGSAGALYTAAAAVASSTLFRNNSAIISGGAVQITAGGSLTLAACTLDSNAAYNAAGTAPATGGGVYAEGTGSLDASDTVFSFNAADNGGAIFAPYPGAVVVTLTRCVLRGNTAGTSGGGVHLSTASTSRLMATDCVFDANVASGGSGGGVYAEAVTATGSSFSNNSASIAGGALAASYVDDTVLPVRTTAASTSANVSIANCTFVSNSAGESGAGGAVLLRARKPARIAASVFTANTAMEGGALALLGGSALIQGSVLTGNAAAGTSPHGGALYATDAGGIGGPSLSLDGVNVFNNSAAVVTPALTPGASFTTYFGAGWGGGVCVIALLPAQLSLTGGTALSGNSATRGGGVFTYGAVAFSVAGGLMANNSASDSGGALGMQSAVILQTGAARRRRVLLQSAAQTYAASATLSAGAVLAANSADSGGAVALNSGSALSAAGVSLQGNSATNGACFMLQVAADGSNATLPALTLNNISAVGNVAYSGALFFTDSPSAVQLPACVGCALSNSEQNGGAAPTAYNGSALALPAVSGKPLPPFNVTLYDVYGDVVPSWPDLIVSIASPADFTGLSGTTAVAYAAGAASFTTLAVTDVVGARHVLTYTLASATLAALSGRTGTLTVTVQPCGADEVFDNETTRCTCAAGAYSNGVACVACSRGLVTTSAGAASCEACPPRTAWVSASLCVACPANAVTAPDDPGRCACDYGFYDILYGVNVTAPVCAACPFGGLCATGFVGAKENFWRENNVSDVFYRCDALHNCNAHALIAPPVAGAARATASRRMSRGR